MKVCLALLLTLNWTLFPTGASAGEQAEDASAEMAIAVFTTSGIRYLPVSRVEGPGGEMMFTPFSCSITRVRLKYTERSGLLVLRCSTIRFEGNNWPRDERLWKRVAEFRMRLRIGETLADKRLADLGVAKVVITTAFSPVPNPAQVWTSVKTIEVIDVREEFRGRYQVSLKNNSSEAIEALAFRHSGGSWIEGLRDEDRLVAAGDTFTRRWFCRPGSDCELHVLSALSVQGTCTGEVGPCRLLMAQWRGRQVAARLVLSVLEEAERQQAMDVSRLADAILALDLRGSFGEAANDLMRSTRARAVVRHEVEHWMLIGANGLVNDFKERLADRSHSFPLSTQGPKVRELLQSLIDKCRRIVSKPSPGGKDRLRL